jgi:pyridoxal phosphate enzyme (YggS family)
MLDAEIRARLHDRLQQIEARIAAACQRAGRRRADVTLVAVTKTVDERVARLLAEMGVVDLGENRPQELWRKAEALKDLPIRWHMIGSLQRNKVERTLPLCRLIHAVDSERLLAEIDKLAGKRGGTAKVLLEVNASREANKHGFAPEQVAEVIASAGRYGNLTIDGLMTMAAYTPDPEQSRPTFAEVRALRDAARLAHLSRGMSNDFEVAIEEGATFLRLGTVLFEGLEHET